MYDDFEILKKQIEDNFYQEESSFDRATLTEIFIYFFTEYQKAFKREHPYITSKGLQEIIKNISSVSVTHLLNSENIFVMIETYFNEKHLNCGYTIGEFARLNTLESIYYKSVYNAEVVTTAKGDTI